MFRNASKYFLFGAAAITLSRATDSKQCANAFCDVSLPPLPYDYKALEPHIGEQVSVTRHFPDCNYVLDSVALKSDIAHSP